jgi:hypothetical protein
MAISEAYSGTATISTTEYSLPNAGTTLTPITEDGVYELVLDTYNMASGDVYDLKFYEKARSGDTQRVFMAATIAGAQTMPIYISESFILLHGWDMTMKKISGTDRTFYWSIRKVA